MVGMPFAVIRAHGASRREKTRLNEVFSRSNRSARAALVWRGGERAAQ